MLDLQGSATRHPAESPFSFIDRVLGVQTGERAVALRNVTANDPLVASGGLRRAFLVEAFAQLASIALSPEDRLPSAVEIAKIESMTFSRTPVPGDQIVLTVELSRPEEGARLKALCKAEVDGEVISQGAIEIEDPASGDVAG